MYVNRASFRSFTFQEMWQWCSVHKRLQAVPQAGNDHERKMAQEAYCSIRQRLVMKEDDITTKSLKRFRQYILERWKPQQDIAGPCSNCHLQHCHHLQQTALSCDKGDAGDRQRGLEKGKSGTQKLLLRLRLLHRLLHQLLVLRRHLM